LKVAAATGSVDLLLASLDGTKKAMMAKACLKLVQYLWIQTGLVRATVIVDPIWRKV
jgi:hypothetical protein